MKKKELVNLIKKYSEKKFHKKIKSAEWDSLTHLNILIDLEKKYSSKVSKIKNLSQANTYNKLLKALTSSGIVKE